MKTRENFVGRRTHDAYVRHYELAKTNNHEYWIDDIPVTKQLHEFLREIKARWFDLTLCVDYSPIGTFRGENDYWIYNKVGITSADAPHMRVGWLSFAENNFQVQSPKIENEKFSRNSDGYRIRKSKDMRKMVKVARQYLKPPTVQDVLDESRHALNSALYNVRDPARSKFREKLGIDLNDIADEVAHMLALGYQPATRSFREALDVMRTEGAELKRLKDYAPRVCFVWAKQNSLVYKYEDSAEAVEITDFNDLPEVLNTKLGVLNIAQEGSAIPDVGVRVNPATFWVFV